MEENTNIEAFVRFHFASVAITNPDSSHGEFSNPVIFKIFFFSSASNLIFPCVFVSENAETVVEFLCTF